MYELVEDVATAIAGARTHDAVAARLRETFAAHLPLRRLELEFGGTSVGRARPDVVVALRHGAIRLELEASTELPREVSRAIGAVVDAVLCEKALVRRVADLSKRAHRESAELRESVEATPSLVYESEVMADIVTRAGLVAAYDTTVLVEGESGVGKELFARYVHGRSRRRRRPFIAVNCGSIPEQLIESELFGHERGAFTGAAQRHRGVFERASGGTLFLDEVGELSSKAQVELLRVLQERRFVRVGGETELEADVRVIAATHRDLQDRLRKDLYYRLAVFSIRVPALRERPDDIPRLVTSLLRRIADRLGRDVPVVSAQTMQRLVAYHWPGNVRELENVLESALITSRSRLALPSTFRVKSTHAVRPLDETIRTAIEAALTTTGGKVYGDDGAAALLGLKPPTLQSKMRKLGIDRRAFMQG